MPTIVLPFAAILLSASKLPWHWFGLDWMHNLLDNAGSTVFLYLPIIFFAVGVALGLTEGAGIAGMSALVSYFIFTRLTQMYLGGQFQLGVSGGILIGLLAAVSFHRFKKFKAA